MLQRRRQDRDEEGLADAALRRGVVEIAARPGIFTPSASQSTTAITVGPPSTAKTQPKQWPGPRFETQGSTPLTMKPPATRLPPSSSFSIPLSVFIGFESAVAPIASPAAMAGRRRSRRPALAVFSRYQAQAFWHHIRK